VSVTVFNSLCSRRVGALRCAFSGRLADYQNSAFAHLQLGFVFASIQSSGMPTYEYVCEKCGQSFEKAQSISAKALTTCPKELCRMSRWGKGKVKRAITGGAGLLFKGSGFYITDYRSEKYKEAAKKDSAPSGGEGSKPGGESKGAAEKPAKPAETKVEKKASPPSPSKK
jgi:putative FmdB family regulatory protein